MSPAMPAEWAERDACLMVWPTRAELWGPAFDAAKREYAAVARAIADFEPVIMIAVPDQAEEAPPRAAVPPTVSPQRSSSCR
ncbi:agmatine deiminase family protein [Streptomyces sp. NPDC059193]|uniref:agmatine deiminase family protein n=1 Tax=Streptomyces sp. NPDC059193 TaxID=3346763 RepID=UPI00368F2FF3